MPQPQAGLHSAAQLSSEVGACHSLLRFGFLRRCRYQYRQFLLRGWQVGMHATIVILVVVAIMTSATTRLLEPTGVNAIEHHMCSPVIPGPLLFQLDR